MAHILRGRQLPGRRSGPNDRTFESGGRGWAGIKLSLIPAGQTPARTSGRFDGSFAYEPGGTLSGSWPFVRAIDVHKRRLLPAETWTWRAASSRSYEEPLYRLRAGPFRSRRPSSATLRSHDDGPVRLGCSASSLARGDGPAGSAARRADESSTGCDRRLKLRVSRGALVKARRQAADGSGASPDKHAIAPHADRRGVSCEDVKAGPAACVLYANPAPATPPPPRPDQRQKDECVAGISSSAAQKQPAGPDDAFVLTHPSFGNCCMGRKALRRLKRCFPELEARFAELRLQIPDAPATRRDGGFGVGSGTKGAAVTENARRPRLRDRLWRWFRRLRRAVRGRRSNPGTRG
ncbi:hypothetical protein VTH06DRAFT_8030 [Thermothelomyces fergusii]